MSIGLGNIAAWLRGRGAAPLHNLMEDAATAEIGRTQLWQRRITGQPLDDWWREVGDISSPPANMRRRLTASALMLSDRLEPFPTLLAYERNFAT